MHHVPITRRAVLGASLGSLAAVLPGHAATKGDFRYAAFHPKTHTIALHWLDKDGAAFQSLAALKADLTASGKQVLALANAGIYGRNFKPLGLHIENGQTLHKLNKGSGGGNFFLKPNGVFYVTEAGAGIVRSTAFKDPGALHATQSGPLLFDKDGIHPRFLEKSPYRHIRNGVGVKDDGTVVLAISKRPVTFWEFATFLRDETDCSAGLYLDGAISKMWLGDDLHLSQFKPFVGMISVTERN